MFEKNLRIFINQRNLSKEDVAKAVGVSSKQVARWLAGTSKPTVQNIVVLSRTFDVSSDWLLGIEMPITALTDSEVTLIRRLRQRDLVTAIEITLRLAQI
jgi:transcriptional regulator with XRE-family HTH domain